MTHSPLPLLLAFIFHPPPCDQRPPLPLETISPIPAVNFYPRRQGIQEKGDRKTRRQENGETTNQGDWESGRQAGSRETARRQGDRDIRRRTETQEDGREGDNRQRDRKQATLP